MRPFRSPKAHLGHMGPIHHVSTCTQEKSVNFFKIRVFPETRVELGVDGPHKIARHPQDTTSTPPASCCRLPIRPVDRGADGRSRACYLKGEALVLLRKNHGGFGATGKLAWAQKKHPLLREVDFLLQVAAPKSPWWVGGRAGRPSCRLFWYLSFPSADT